MNRTATLHLLTEFAPTIAFFIALELTDFFIATTILMTTTFVSLGISWYYEQRIPALPLIAAAFVLVFGALTHILQDPDMLIIADSTFYFLLATIIGLGQLANVSVLKMLFSSVFAMTDTGWRILSVRWFLLLIVVGLANEYIRIMYTPEVWADFRLVKIFLISLFSFYQFTLARRYRIPTEANAWGMRIKEH